MCGSCFTPLAHTWLQRCSTDACSGSRSYVLTQFNSHQLNTHISQAYPPVAFGSPKRQGFVDVLAAHQTPSSSAWCASSPSKFWERETCSGQVEAPASLLCCTVLLQR